MSPNVGECVVGNALKECGNRPVEIEGKRMSAVGITEIPPTYRNGVVLNTVTIKQQVGTTTTNQDNVNS